MLNKQFIKMYKFNSFLLIHTNIYDINNKKTTFSINTQYINHNQNFKRVKKKEPSFQQ